MLQGADRPIKVEIILEGRIALDAPGAKDEVCGVASLTPSDMASSKLLEIRIIGMTTVFSIAISLTLR